MIDHIFPAHKVDALPFRKQIKLTLGFQQSEERDLANRKAISVSIVSSQAPWDDPQEFPDDGRWR